jgi:predicted nucleic acid-binding protein
VKPRAVLDTSVLLSAERHELLFLAHRKLYTIIWSSFLVNEIARVRTELAIKHGQDRNVYRARLNQFISEVSRLAILVDYTRLEGGSYTEWLKDPDDEPLLATALVGRAHCVVSWNTKDFPPTGSFAGVRYLTPPQFLADLYRQHPRRKKEFAAEEYRAP